MGVAPEFSADRSTLRASREERLLEISSDPGTNRTLWRALSRRRANASAMATERRARTLGKVDGTRCRRNLQLVKHWRLNWLTRRTPMTHLCSTDWPRKRCARPV